MNVISDNHIVIQRIEVNAGILSVRHVVVFQLTGAATKVHDTGESPDETMEMLKHQIVGHTERQVPEGKGGNPYKSLHCKALFTPFIPLPAIVNLLKVSDNSCENFSSLSSIKSNAALQKIQSVLYHRIGSVNELIPSILEDNLKFTRSQIPVRVGDSLKTRTNGMLGTTNRQAKNLVGGHHTQ